MQQRLPDRERWLGWVYFAWVLAGAACILGFFMIAKLGFIEVPSSSRYVTRTEPNIMIWVMGVGQSLSAIMLAVLFSILNSIYQNTCDQRIDARKALTGEEPKPATPAKKGEVLRLTEVLEESPLNSVLSPGCVILKINDDWAGDVEWAKSLIKNGANKFQYINTSRNHEVKWIHLTHEQPLLIKGEADVMSTETL